MEPITKKRRDGSDKELPWFPSLDDVLREHSLHALELCAGNCTAAARALGVDRKTLYRRLRRWGAISKPAHDTGEVS
jgi:transcriptional regulator of acetoin/glycerol metabolism